MVVAKCSEVQKKSIPIQVQVDEGTKENFNLSFVFVDVLTMLVMQKKNKQFKFTHKEIRK